MICFDIVGYKWTETEEEEGGAASDIPGPGRSVTPRHTVTQSRDTRQLQPAALYPALISRRRKYYYTIRSFRNCEYISILWNNFADVGNSMVSS